MKSGFEIISRSLKMAPFDRRYTTFYWSAIVNIALSSCIIPFSSYLTLNNIVTLKSGLEITQGHWNWHGFLFAFHGNYGSILHHFRDKAKHWSKIPIFSYPLHSTPPLRGSPSKYYHMLWCGQTRMVTLPDGEKSLMICRTVSTEYRRVTDG